MNKCSIRRGKCVKTVTINSKERYKSPTDRHTHRLHAHMGNRQIMSWTKRAPSLTKHERMEQFKCRDAVLFRQENYFQLHRTRLAHTMRIENRWAYSMSWVWACAKANFGALGNVCVAKTVLRREKKNTAKKDNSNDDDGDDNGRSLLLLFIVSIVLSSLCPSRLLCGDFCVVSYLHTAFILYSKFVWQASSPFHTYAARVLIFNCVYLLCGRKISFYSIRTHTHTFISLYVSVCACCFVCWIWCNPQSTTRLIRSLCLSNPSVDFVKDGSAFHFEAFVHRWRIHNRVHTLRNRITVDHQDRRKHTKKNLRVNVNERTRGRGGKWMFEKNRNQQQRQRQHSKRER